jgi:hypothetical protein
MNDQSQKKDAGKPTPHLIPWYEFPITEARHSVDAVAHALRVWWAGRPFPLDMAIPRAELAGVARVLAFGAAKYAPRGWERGISYSRLFDAALRHADAVERGEHTDPESGLPHVSHFWCNVMFLRVFATRGRDDLDDRPEGVRAVVETLERAKAMLENPFDAVAEQRSGGESN